MKCYHVDAFAEKVFEGNPAAVCVLDKYPSDALMQKIAGENNLSETAFAVKEGADGLPPAAKLTSAVMQHWVRLMCCSVSLKRTQTPSPSRP